MEQVTSENIQELKENEIFVFGSNMKGFHGAGAAKIAYEKFGAEMGKCMGLMGNSFGIPTKDYDYRITLSLVEIEAAIKEFIKFAKDRTDLIFYVTQIGCGYAGYKPDSIALFFKECVDLKNVYLPKVFINIIKKNDKKGNQNLFR